MDIEKLKNRYLENVEELEKEVNILSDRIKKSKEEISKISNVEDANKFVSENDLKEGLVHLIALFG